MSTEFGRVEGPETGTPAAAHISASSSITKSERSSSSSATATSTSGFLTRGARLEIKVRNKIPKLGPHPHILATLLFKLCKHVLIRSNRRHGRKERALHRLTNRPTLRAAGRPPPAPPCPALPSHTQPPGSSWRLLYSYYNMGPRPPSCA